MLREFYAEKVTPRAGFEPAIPKGTVFETVAIPLDDLGILIQKFLNNEEVSGHSPAFLVQSYLNILSILYILFSANPVFKFHVKNQKGTSGLQFFLHFPLPVFLSLLL